MSDDVIVHLTQLASYVITFTPAGFQRLRLQPSAHMAPREIKDTVPSPSPIRTPFLTCVEYQWYYRGVCGSSRLWSGRIIRQLVVNPI